MKNSTIKKFSCVFICLVFFCLSIGLLNFISPQNARAEESVQAGKSKTDYTYVTSEIDNLSVVVSETGICFTGQMESSDFEVVGSLYHIYDGMESDKYFFVDNNSNDFNNQFYVLNLEYELNVSSPDLPQDRLDLLGKNVIRFAAYIENEVYYAEQEYNIDQSILMEAIELSINSDSEILRTIASNSAWFTHLYEKELVEVSPNVIQPMATSSTPKYSSDLDATDRAIIQKIGISKFDQKQYIYGWTYVAGKITGGYVLESVEWPSGSGSILTYCLYYEIVTNVPTERAPRAEIQFSLVADRQYRWFPDDNTVRPYFRGTDFRLYDVKLAIECAQYTSGKGFDYISSRTVYINSTTTQCKAGDIALSIAKQFDKYKIITYSQLIFDAFSKSDKDSGNSSCIWPTNFDEHYASVSNGKHVNTMVRGVRVDTKGHKITKENNHVLLKADIVDRDYSTSSSDIAMKKAIKFAFSYNLRSKNGFWIWLFKGDDCGNIGDETYKTYTL